MTWRKILALQTEGKCPPRHKEQVKELKKDFPEESAYAIAWDSYNKGKKKRKRKSKK